MKHEALLSTAWLAFFIVTFTDQIQIYLDDEDKYSTLYDLTYDTNKWFGGSGFPMTAS